MLCQVPSTAHPYYIMLVRAKTSRGSQQTFIEANEIPWDMLWALFYHKLDSSRTEMTSLEFSKKRKCVGIWHGEQLGSKNAECNGIIAVIVHSKTDFDQIHKPLNTIEDVLGPELALLALGLTVMVWRLVRSSQSSERSRTAKATKTKTVSTSWLRTVFGNLEGD